MQWMSHTEEKSAPAVNVPILSDRGLLTGLTAGCAAAAVVCDAAVRGSLELTGWLQRPAAGFCMAL